MLVTVGALLGRSGLVHVYAGLTLLVLAWWRYGRGGTDRPWLTLALWTAPLLAAPPLFSRDVYSYLAQGLMLSHSIDVHRYGPAALGGPIAARVPAIWQDTPSPYGPVSMVVARAVTGDHPAAGVLGMRLAALAGLALLALVVPVLAPGRTAAVRHLVVLNPLVLIHLVGGAHNDALMVGLLAAGLAAAVRDRPIAAAALVTAAGLVKAPAALGLAAVAMTWASRLPGRRPGLRAGPATVAVAGATTVALTAFAGTGYGWIGALGTPVSPGNWAPTALLGRGTAALIAHDDIGAALSMQLWRWAGVLATLMVAGLVWTYRHRIGALPGLGLVLLAVAVLGPAFRPWYVIWALVPLAVAGPAAHRRLAVLCTVLTPVVLPDGYAADLSEILAAVLGVLLGVAVSGLVHRPAPARVAR